MSKGEIQHLGATRAECFSKIRASVSPSHVRERRAQQEKGRAVWIRLSEAWGATKCHRGCIVHTIMMGRAIEKPLRAPWGYLFPQTHGKCVLTICHPLKLLLFSICVYLMSARDVSWKPTWNSFFFPIRYLWHKGHHQGLVQFWMYPTLIQPSHLLFRLG